MAKASPVTYSAPDVSEFICFAVYSLAQAFNRVYKPLLDQVGLTYPQYLVLVALWKMDDQAPSQLGEALSLESDALTLLLKSLEDMGWVTRVPTRADEREIRVQLTSEGRSLREKAREFPACIEKATGLAPTELTRLRRELIATRRNVLAALR